jgi:hypothetical protein
MNQAFREDCLMEKTEGRKSCDTVPLTRKAQTLSLLYIQTLIMTLPIYGVKAPPLKI